MLVDVYEVDGGLIEADADFREYVPAAEQVDARYNLENHGIYTVYRTNGVNHRLKFNAEA